MLRVHLVPGLLVENLYTIERSGRSSYTLAQRNVDHVVACHASTQVYSFPQVHHQVCLSVGIHDGKKRINGCRLAKCAVEGFFFVLYSTELVV